MLGTCTHMPYIGGYKIPLPISKASSIEHFGGNSKACDTLQDMIQKGLVLT